MATKKSRYTEPTSYFPKSIRKSAKIGEYAPKAESKAKKKK